MNAGERKSLTVGTPREFTCYPRSSSRSLLASELEGICEYCKDAFRGAQICDGHLLRPVGYGSLKCFFVAGNKPGADVGTQFARF